jgi:serine phosphatase RsbU (regulator of sigma subunit)
VAIADLLRELGATRRALWLREAELAAGVPIAPRDDEELHLAERLESVLKVGAQAVDCQAAAAYLLDDATKQLKLRSCWGLPKSRFLDPPRPLRGAAADLEALVGHAVVLEDTSFLPHWKVPEEFRSAACVPISSPTFPFGTLWMFCEHPRDFSVAESNLIEIVAGRVAADLEREMLLQQTLKSKKLNRQVLMAAQRQRDRLPRIKPLVAGWQIAGWTAQRDVLGGDFHDWFILPDSSLAAVVGDAAGRMIEAEVTSATLHTALKSHACYRHTAQQMIERVNETIWSSSSGDQFASLLYVLVQPDSGLAECVAAGRGGVTVVGETLRTLVADGGPPLGTQPDSDYSAAHDRLAAGEILIMYSEGVQKLLKGDRKRVLWNLIRQQRDRSADDLVERTQSALREFGDGLPAADQTVVIVKREPR